MNPDTHRQEMDAAFRFFGYNFSADQLQELQKKAVRSQMNHHSDQSASYPPEIESLWNDLRRRHASQFER